MLQWHRRRPPAHPTPQPQLVLALVLAPVQVRVMLLCRLPRRRLPVLCPWLACLSAPTAVGGPWTT